MEQFRESNKNSLTVKLKNFFIAGIVVVAPIGFTFLVVRWFVTFIDSILYTVLPSTYQPDRWFGFKIPGVGLLVSLILIVVIGFLATHYLGKPLVSLFEKIIQRIPLVNSIYTLFKQVTDSTLGKDAKGFRKPVLLEYPRKGLWSIGFMTGVTSGEIQDITEHRVINIFVPTTPNPTSGFYVLVPEKDILPLSMTVEEAFKLIISGGMVTPPHPAVSKSS